MASGQCTYAFLNHKSSEYVDYTSEKVVCLMIGQKHVYSIILTIFGADKYICIVCLCVR